ncbi:MAG: phosphoglucosamine mutase [Alphaproteobacteria bacterium]|nr:phosphoglucosamine mutase [Alphaproteobacteria bacterium]
MTRHLFGTDGVRGKVNQEPMTAPTLLKLAMAAAMQFKRGNHRHHVVIGKDTRLSGYMIEPALTSGFVCMGMDVTLLGPLPTPAVAMLTRSLRADLGVMISASHNPFDDNGIKLFGPDGNKLSDETEMQIEKLMKNDLQQFLADPKHFGRAKRLDDAAGRYIEFVKNSFPKGLRLDGLKIVIDCAEGAAYKVAPAVLWELGAEVISLGTKPDGFNINKKCGAVAPEAMMESVVLHNADLGIALDGDADRLILADEKGARVDGDQIMALIAKSWKDHGMLRGNGIVATVMSNLGLERYLKNENINLHRAAVGDRYVVEQMAKTGCNLGGEQSGHIVMSDFNTTGDGLVAALQILAMLVQTKKKASEALRVFTPVPQKLTNVRVTTTTVLEENDVKDAIAQAEKRLGNQGRLLVRKSGTEPLIRVMAEGDDEALVNSVVSELCAFIQKAA